MIEQTATSAAPAARPAGAEGRTARRITAIVAGAVLTALAARLAVPLPGTAVPFTLQVAAVLLTGVLLGARGGAASQALYLAAGLAGLPVFAAGGGPAYLFGPTGGYLLAFPLAAGVAGWFAGSDRILVKALGLVVAVAVIHAGGMAWLAGVIGVEVTFRTGVIPFLAGDVLKVMLVLVVGAGIGERARKLFA
jgi:biotin transport system substrate-specific component